MKNEREPWQIIAAKFCVENSEKGFSFKELSDYILSVCSVKEAYIRQFYEEEVQSPSGRNYPRNAVDGQWAPPLDLVAKVTDYEELKEARESSRQAMKMAIASLILATIVGITQILIQVFDFHPTESHDCSKYTAQAERRIQDYYSSPTVKNHTPNEIFFSKAYKTCVAVWGGIDLNAMGGFTDTKVIFDAQTNKEIFSATFYSGQELNQIMLDSQMQQKEKYESELAKARGI